MEAGARITIDNHPKGGPVFTGPHVQPWICQTEENNLGPPLDEDCNAPTDYDFWYMPAEGGGFQEYDPDNPPDDSEVATTTTTEDETVRYMVRVERGTLNRGYHEVAFLFDPEADEPLQGWNHKLGWTFGGGCSPNHEQGTGPGDVLNDMWLSRGFALSASTMTVRAQNCNEVTAAETVMMMKEHIIEHYGPIRYTIGEGCSGGARQQWLISSHYPGLLDGIRPDCTVQDTWGYLMDMTDCHLLLKYFTETSPHLWGNTAQQAAVDGHGPEGRAACPISEALELGAGYFDPTIGAGCAEYDWSYDPENNPNGVRCTPQDFQVAIWGRRPGDGFAYRVYDTVGIQYGLAAVLDGTIQPEQFVDLNEKIGGLDYDAVRQPQRSEAELIGLQRAYRTGQIADAHALERIPIIDMRAFEEQIHPTYWSWVAEARLLRDNGHAENHAIWYYNGGLGVNAPYEASLEMMDEWLAAIEADTSGDPVQVKVRRHKPGGHVDSCWSGNTRIADNPDACVKQLDRDSYNPRMVAGMPMVNDIAKCQLRPFDPADYANAPVPFTDDQLARLEAAFPQGVCDFSQRSVGYEPTALWGDERAQEPSLDWLTYEDGPGGQPLGPEPVSVPFGIGTDDRSSGGPDDPATVGYRGELPVTGGGAAAFALGALVLVALRFGKSG